MICEYEEFLTTPRFRNSFIYAGSRLLMTISRASSSSETTKLQHPDRLGTNLITNVHSGATDRQSTLPFGTYFAAETTGLSTRTFTSYDRRGLSDLDYAVNRTYSPGQTRFTQVDPIGMASASLGNPQSNNLYSYVQNML